MFGLLLVGTLATVVLAYVVTEFLLMRLDVRRRVLVGDGWLLITILCVNAVSLLVVCIVSVVVLFATGTGLYASAVMVCIGVQAVWLSQHLWFYHRDHLRLGW